MIAFLARRVALAAVTMLVAVSLIFLAVRMLPGNPLLARFGQHPDAEQIQALRRQYGWDRPLVVQLGEFLWTVATTGDLGRSVARSNVSVSRELGERVPATMELTLAAVALALPLGIAAGVVAAVWRGRWPDQLCMLGSLVGVSVPVFFLGIALQALFRGLPSSQRLPPSVLDFQPLTGFYLLDTLAGGRWDLFLLAAQHLVLPAVALSSIPAAIVARLTRSSLLETLAADYVRTARAKGAGPWRTVLRHALPNAAVPIANIAGLQVGLLLSGAVLTETVFDWPGLGQYVAAAVVRDRDYAAAQAGAIVIAAVFVLTNLLLDLLYAWLDPRIRTAGGLARG